MSFGAWGMYSLAHLAGGVAWPAKVAAGLFLVVFGLGYSMFYLLGGARWAKRGPLKFPEVVASCLVSFFIFFAIGAALALTFQLRWELLFGAISIIVVPSGLLALRRVGREEEEVEQASLAIRTFPFLMIAVASVLLFSYFQSFTPYPTISGWDLYHNLAATKAILSADGTPYLLVPLYPPGPTAPYPGGLAILTASLALFLQVDPLAVHWAGIGLLFIAYASLVFGLGVSLSQNKFLSFLAAFIAIFLGAGRGDVVRTPLFLTPDMGAQLIILSLLLLHLSDRERALERLLLTGIGILFLTLFYYYAVLAALPLLFYVGLEAAFPHRKVLRERVFSALLGLMLIAAIAASLTAAFGDDVVQAAVGTFGIGWEAKLDTIVGIYHPVFLLLLIFVLYSNGLHLWPVRGDRLHYRHLFLYAGMLLLIYFLPPWPTYRFEFYARVPLCLGLTGFSSQGLRARWARANRRARIRGRGRTLASIVLGTFSRRQGAIFVAATIALSSSFVLYANIVDSRLSPDESRAAAWIEAHTDNGAYIATDPSSGFVMRGLTFRNASTLFILPDGRVPADSTLLYPGLEDRLLALFRASSAGEAAAQIEGLPPGELYVLVTSRTAQWALEDPSQLYAHPIPWANVTKVASVFSPPTFQPVLRFDTVVMFRVVR